MYQLKKNGLKWLKAVHLVAISGWLGGGMVLYLFTLLDQQIPIAYLGGLYWLADAVDMKLVVPCAMVTLLTGILYGSMTPWGFFRQKWLIVKWLLTAGVILSGSIMTHTYLRNLATFVSLHGNDVLANAQYAQMAGQNSLLSLLQLAMLIAAVVVSIWKPWRSTKNSKS